MRRRLSVSMNQELQFIAPMNSVQSYLPFRLQVKQRWKGISAPWACEAGLMDDQEYRNSACKKLRLYCNNGIILSIDLIATFETADHPLDVERVEKIIQEFLL